MKLKSEEFKAAMSKIRERIATSIRRETHRGFIDYHGCSNVCHDFLGILEDAEKSATAGYYALAYSQAALIQINLAKLASKADDSAGNITYTRGIVTELLEKVSENVKYEPEEARYIFLASAKDAQNKAFEDWTEFGYDLIEKTARLAGDDTEQKMYEALDDLFSKSENEYTTWHHEHDALVRLEIIKATHGQIDAAEFIAKNMQYTSIRKIAIQNAISKGNFDIAEKLCFEKLSDDTPTSQWSQPCEWRYALYEVHEKAGNTIKQIETARDLLFRYDAKYYEVLKKLLTERGLWSDEYNGLLTTIESCLPYPIYMDIFSKEKEATRLFKAVQQYPSEVFAYGKQLSKQFSQEIYAICMNEIHQQAEKADKRPRYKGVCSNIKRLFAFGGTLEAKCIIAKLIEKYPRRTAFVDELEMLLTRIEKR